MGILFAVYTDIERPDVAVRYGPPQSGGALKEISDFGCSIGYPIALFCQHILGIGPQPDPDAPLAPILYGGQPWVVALAVGTAFLIGGIAAGFLGAGALAHIVAAVGMMSAFIIYIQAVIAAFAGIPPIFSTFMTGLTLTLGAYSILRMLRG